LGKALVIITNAALAWLSSAHFYQMKFIIVLLILQAVAGLLSPRRALIRSQR